MGRLGRGSVSEDGARDLGRRRRDRPHQLGVRADQGCKVHKHQVDRAAASSGNHSGETWEQQKARLRKEELEIEAKEKLVREAVFRAMEEAHGAGNEQFLRLLVANSIAGSDSVFVCKALDVEFTPPKNGVGSFEERELADEALVEALLTRPMSFVVEASFYSLAGQTLRINTWQMKRDPKEDRGGLWKYATMLGVDADAIAGRVEREQAAAAQQISAAADESPAASGKQAKKKLTAAEQKTRKAATKKKHTLTYERASGAIQSDCNVVAPAGGLEEGWYDLDTAEADLSIEIDYLDARRLLERHPDHPNWIILRDEGDPLDEKKELSTDGATA